MFGTGDERGLLRFPLFGVPVTIDWTFLMVPLFAVGGGWERALTWTAVIFVSVLLHELGHAVAMRAFGLAPRITLYAFGGLTFWPAGAAPSPKQNFVVSGAGPAVSISLGLVSLVVFVTEPSSPAIASIVRDSLFVNLFWGAINLLPMLPLDGGHMLDTGATIITGTPRPRWVGLVSLVTGVGVAVGALALGQPFLGLIGVFAVLRGWERWANRGPDLDAAIGQAMELAFSGKPAEAEGLLRLLETAAKTDEERARVRESLVWTRVAAKDFEGAEALARTVPAGWRLSAELRARLLAAKDDVDGVIDALLPEVTNGALTVTAAPLLASALLARSRLRELEATATLMLATAKDRSDPAGRVFADLTARLFHANEPAACLRLCELAWRRFSNGEDAFNAACCHVKLNEPDAAMRWLGEAVRAGMPKLREALEQDPDVAALRERDDFKALLGRVSS
jgi:Zn-dependent protease